MRDIRFRAWDKVFKCWLQAFMIAEDGRVSEPLGGKDWTDQVELMQYTGLKDAKGMDIYEGDILLWHDHKVKVIYGGIAFGFEGLEPYANKRVEFNYDTITNPNIKTLDDGEVIGNVWEHPNLLST